MNGPVTLDDESCLSTKKVSDVIAELMLSPEFETQKLTIS